MFGAGTYYSYGSNMLRAQKEGINIASFLFMGHRKQKRGGKEHATDAASIQPEKNSNSALKLRVKKDAQHANKNKVLTDENPHSTGDLASLDIRQAMEKKLELVYGLDQHFKSIMEAIRLKETRFENAERDLAKKEKLLLALDSELANKQEKLDRKKQQVESLGKELAAQHLAVTRQKKQLSAMARKNEQELARFTMQIEAKRAAIEELGLKVHELDSRYKSQMGILEKLEEEKLAKEAQISDAQMRINDLVFLAAKKEEQLKLMENELGRKTISVKEHLDSAEKRKKEIEMETLELKRLSDEKLREAALKLETTSKEHRRLQKNILLAQKNADEIQQRIAVGRKAIESEQQKYNSLQSKIEGSHTELENIKLEMAKHRKAGSEEIADLARRAGKLKIEIENLAKDKAKLLTYINDIKKDAKAADDEFFAGQSRLKQIELDIQEKEARSRDFQKNLQIQQDSLNAQKIKLTEKEKQLESYELELKAKASQIEAMSKDKEKLEMQAQHIEKEIDSKVKEKERKLSKLIADEGRLKENLNRLWESLKDKKKEEDLAIAQLKLLRKEIAKVPLSKAAKRKIEKSIKGAEHAIDEAESDAEMAVQAAKAGTAEISAEIKEVRDIKTSSHEEEALLLVERKIRHAYDAYESRDYHAVQNIYAEIKEIYAGLDPSKRSHAYKLIMDLREKVSGHK